MSQQARLKAYSKIIRGFLMVASGIYELIFGEEAPRHIDVIRIQ